MGDNKSRIRILAICISLCLLSSMQIYAANNIENIKLQKSADSIVVTITTSVASNFNAFLTDSKPERIVIDFDEVRNTWKTKKFMDLPSKSLPSIRTSQYKTEPIPITRVVLDVNKPVEIVKTQKDNDVIIKFAAVEGESDFAMWQVKTSTPTPKKPQKTVVQKVKKKQAPKPKPVVTGEKIESYPKRKIVSYRTSGYRDPFVPLVGATGQLSTGLPAIENLVLVGILEDIDGNRALLEDAEGNGYILMANDRIKNGYLVNVTSKKAVFQVTEYGWTRTVALELDMPEIK